MTTDQREMLRQHLDNIEYHAPWWSGPGCHAATEIGESINEARAILAADEQDDDRAAMLPYLEST